MTQSCLIKPPFTDSNYSLPQSIVARHNNEQVRDSKTTSTLSTKGEQEPPRKIDIFKKLPKKTTMTTSLLQNSIMENGTAEKKDASYVSSEIRHFSIEPLKPPPNTIFKKVQRPPNTNVCSTVSTDANKTPQNPITTAPAINKRPIFITPSKKTTTTTMLHSIPLDDIPLGSLVTTIQTTITNRDSISTSRYNSSGLVSTTLLQAHEQVSTFQSTEELYDLTDNLSTSLNQRKEPSDDNISTCRSKTNTKTFEDDFSDII